MSEETEIDQARASGRGPHKLRCKVRPPLPDDAAPFVLVWVNRQGHIVIPLQDRPGQRTAIEREGGVWDPADEVYRFDNAKKRDAVQRELDDAERKINDAVRSSSVTLAPGLNLAGARRWAELAKLEQVKRVERFLEVIDEPVAVKAATLIDYIKRTGTRSVLQHLLELELPAAVIKAATKQLDELNAGRVPKVSRAG